MKRVERQSTVFLLAQGGMHVNQGESTVKGEGRNNEPTIHGVLLDQRRGAIIAASARSWAV